MSGPLSPYVLINFLSFIFKKKKLEAVDDHVPITLIDEQKGKKRRAAAN